VIFSDIVMPFHRGMLGASQPRIERLDAAVDELVRHELPFFAISPAEGRSEQANQADRAMTAVDRFWVFHRILSFSSSRFGGSHLSLLSSSKQVRT